VKTILIHLLNKITKKVWSRQLMTAMGTLAVQLKLVRADREAMPGGNLILKPFDLLVLEFHDLSAPGADEVVVMALVGHVVVLRLGAEMPGLGQARFAEQIQCAVNGRQSDVRVFLGQKAVHLLGGDVLVLEERLQNVFALPGELELVLGEMVLQDADLLGKLGHVRPDRHEAIKNQCMKGRQVPKYRH
jgi:hypothetical protein